MNNFIIKEIYGSEYKLLVIATTYISPIQTLDDIELEIPYHTGKVIFDLILINGVNRNRYIEAEVLNGKFIRKSFKIASNIDDDIKSYSVDYFKGNKEVLKNGTISNALKQHISLGSKL